MSGFDYVNCEVCGKLVSQEKMTVSFWLGDGIKMVSPLLKWFWPLVGETPAGLPGKCASWRSGNRGHGSRLPLCSIFQVVIYVISVGDLSDKIHVLPSFPL